MSYKKSSFRSLARRYRYQVLCLLLVSVCVWLFAMSRPAGTGRYVYALTVHKGDSFAQTAQKLEHQHIVRSSLYLRILGRLRGLDKRVQPGDYRLSDVMKPGDILEKLASGEVDACKFAVPEGYSIYQLAEMVARQGLFSRDAFLSACRDKQLLAEFGIPAETVEGYLFPGTYLVGFHMDERALLTEMLRAFRRRNKGLAQASAATGLTPKQVVTLASMVEKEAVVPQEKPLIASVFRNRLKIGMPLQSDPTAIYGVRAFGGTVTKQDVQRQSPYNTYRIRGIPPGPIGNPGVDAIAAVLHPAHTRYLYFVARKDGTHQFSCTLEEHNRGVCQFLKKGFKRQQ